MLGETLFECTEPANFIGISVPRELETREALHVLFCHVVNQELANSFSEADRDGITDLLVLLNQSTCEFPVVREFLDTRWDGIGKRKAKNAIQETAF